MIYNMWRQQNREKKKAKEMERKKQQNDKELQLKKAKNIQEKQDKLKKQVKEPPQRLFVHIHPYQNVSSLNLGNPLRNNCMKPLGLAASGR